MRVVYKQINNFMESKISKCVAGFRESHGTQHSLIVMLKKWKKALDKEENMSAIFMNLSYYKSLSSTSKTKGIWFHKQTLSST